ncbi:MAG TPA: Gfo/Idh/MocA family oxidoreductase [Planctomycetota bacterium]|nr:Gfo/Idh/MocA family oxidoreductase [Planctomycetota bacterium]
MKDKIGIAIVGCGMISEFQARAIQALPDARLTGFYNRTPAPARRRSEQFGAPVFESLEDLLVAQDVDAVSICTPSGAHLEPALAAFRAHKHVMIEKPLEVTLERVDELLRAADAAGVVIGAIFPRRFQDASRALKLAIDHGRFGRIVLADAHIKWFRSQEYYDGGGWRGTWKLDGGGALMNQGIHGIDLLQWLLGGVEQVSAFTATLAHERIEVEDTAAVAVRFRNGALGTIEGTTGSWPGTKIRLEVHGSLGSVVLEDEVITHWRFDPELPGDADVRLRLGPREGLSAGGSTDPKAISFEGHRRQFDDFVRAIRTGTRPACSGADARAAVALITAIYRSAREGRPARVD